MNPRATGILLLCAVALGAFVWFYEIGGEAGRTAAEEADRRLFAGVEVEDIAWVELDSTEGVRVRAERGEHGWDIVVPLLFPGDTSAWDSVASTLALVTSEASFADPQPPDVYGLGEGADVVRFGLGDEARELRLGDTAPLGGNSYAAVAGAAPVHTVASWRASSLRKEFDALRDKRVLDFDAASVARIEAEWPGARVAIERDGEGWRTSAPVSGPADAAVVDGLLADLAMLQADGFDDAPGSDAERGLAPPAYRVRLTLADAARDNDTASDASDGAASEPRVIELAVGSVIDDGTRRARGAPVSLYRIAAARIDDLPRDVSAYRYKQLADFEVAEAKRLEIVLRDPAGAPVEIVATQRDGAWSSEPEALDPAKLAALVRTLAGLTAQGILAEGVGADELAGLQLSPPLVAFTVRSGEGETALADVRIGVQQGVEGIVAQAGGNPQVFRLPLEVSERLPINLEALRNHFLPSEAPADTAATDAAGPGAGEPATAPGTAFDFDAETLDALLSGEEPAAEASSEP